MTNSRVWLITGASRGIGRAVAERALSHGDRVVIIARGDAVNDLAKELGDNCIAAQADVSDSKAMLAVADKALAKWGQIDVLVNNAGLHRGGRVSKLKEENWQAVLDTNLTGALNGIRAVEPHMSEGAAIINIGAVVGFRGFAGDAAYAASKAGLSGLTRALAIEFAPRGICVNLVIPGLVLTEMTEALSESALESMRGIIPLGRYGGAEEIAQVIHSVSESRYMTGAFIPVDGGLMSSFGVPV
ncbi:MAG: SDR family oxidoreductase [Pseudomonadales bacterium]